MRTFTVEGLNWREDFEVDDTLFDNYEDMAFEAMTQAVHVLLALPGDNGNPPVWHSSCQHVDMSELKRWGDAHPTRGHEEELMFEWVTVAWEKGCEKEIGKKIVALSEYVLRNAGEHEWADLMRDEWRENRRTGGS